MAKKYVPVPSEVFEKQVSTLGLDSLVVNLLHDALPLIASPTEEQPAVFAVSQLACHPTMKMTEWLKLGVLLLAVGRNINWWVGDWLLFGEHRYGDQYAQGVSLLQLDENTLRQWAWTCKVFPPEKRRWDVPFSQYHNMARVAQIAPQQADAFMDVVQEKGLTVSETRSMVNGWKAQHDPDYGRKYLSSAPDFTHVAAVMDVFTLDETAAHVAIAELERRGFVLVKKE